MTSQKIEPIRCLDGLRVLLQMWIVSHSTWVWFSHTSPATRALTYSTPLGVLARHGKPAVACFFVFAAMLSHQQLTRMRSSSLTTYATNSVSWIGHRFWRLWPQVFILTVITYAVAVLVPPLLQWWTASATQINFYPNCRDVPALFWEQLLVVNIAMVGEGLCQGRIWFLQILLDFTVLTPAFVWLLDRARLVGALLCFSVFCMSLAVRLGLYRPYTIYGCEHISSWMTGFALSEALLARDRATALLPVDQRALAAPRPWLVRAGWLATFAVGAASIFVASTTPFADEVPRDKLNEYRWTVEKLATVPFAAAVALLVYLCECDPQAAVARFLSHPRWQWAANLCYDAYLVATPGGAVATWLIVGSDEPQLWRFAASIPVQWISVWAIAYALNRGTQLFHTVRQWLFACVFTQKQTSTSA